MKTILHLCADLGSDSYPFQKDPEYNVIKVGENVGVESFNFEGEVWGVIANPPCTDFSTAPGFDKIRNADTSILGHCLRIIEGTNPKWWVVENPYNGTMKEVLGQPKMVYQPWQFGSPWTKKTALWGVFNKPDPLFKRWEDVPKNPSLYVRPGRPKCSLAFLHKSAIHNIPEFYPFIEFVKNDADFRSLCSQGFARAFKVAQENET